MKNNIHNPINFKILLLAMLAVITQVSQTGYCQDETYVLMIEQSPVDTGIITPGVGIHRFEINQDVKLTATPKVGYRFLYWLGDVTEPTSNETTIFIDAPQMIIAVFERDEYALLTESDMPQKGAGGGGAIATSVNIRGAASAASGLSGPMPRPKQRFLTLPFSPPPFPFVPVPSETPTEDDPTDGNDIPVPDDNPIPEPATITLFSLGASLLMTRRRRIRNTT